MSVAILVIGIVAIIISIIPFVGAFAIYLAIPGVLLGIVPLIWRKFRNGLGIAGLVLAVLAAGISIVQYQMTKAAAHGLQNMQNDLKAEVAEMDRQAELQLAKMKAEIHGESAASASPSAVAATRPPAEPPLNSRPEKRAQAEPLGLHAVYRAQGDGAEVFVVDFENKTDQTIILFRGEIIYCDEFDKPVRRQEVTYRQTIPAKGRKAIATLRQGQQSQIISAGGMSELATQLPLPFADIKIPDRVLFKTTDIRYAP